MATAASATKETRAVFACGGRDFTVRDVIDAACFRGELDRLWRDFLGRNAAAKKAAETEAVMDDAVLDEAAVAFRYKYDLITAEETEAWLEARGLTLADFSEYFARVQWGKQMAAGVDVPRKSFGEASTEERDAFTNDLTLSGEFDRMAERLAWRVAARDAGKEQGKSTDAERERFCARTGVNRRTVAAWLRDLRRDPTWLDELLAMETAYCKCCEERLTPETRQRELTTLRLPLTRFEVELIELESRDAASEAFMCVRDDGMSMEEVAAEGRYPFRRAEMVLEEIPDELQQKFLSSNPGSLLEPTPRDDGYVLTRLVQKKEPSLDDREVRARVEQRILERHFADVSSGRIQWRIMINAAQ